MVYRPWIVGHEVEVILPHAASSSIIQNENEIMDKDRDEYIPALKYRWLTLLYDLLLRWSMRESTFKLHLLGQAQIESGHRARGGDVKGPEAQQGWPRRGGSERHRRGLRARRGDVKKKRL